MNRNLPPRTRHAATVYDRRQVVLVLILVGLVALCVIAALLWRIRGLSRERAALTGALAENRRTVAERVALERAKSEFLATASHELRSPLTSVKGFVELLENGTRDGRFSDREREFVEIIQRSTERLVTLVDELLDVAQIDADHVDLQRRPIDVGEAVQEVAELMGPQLTAKEQLLGIYVAPTLPLAYADSGRIRQVIGNLLANAHLYTPAGGRIHIGAEADRAWVRIVVADSGVGMTEAESARIFERFYRAPSGTAAAPGTGLGLSVVKSLVDLHGGEIEVASRPGAGATFQIRIPAARQEAGNAAATLRGRRVLVVADDATTGERIAADLRSVDVEGRVARSESALQALAAEPVDALAIDVETLGPDGLALVTRVRADPELRATPIVFVAAAGADPRFAGEWTVPEPVHSGELPAVLAAALRARHSRVLVVARPELAPELEPALDELGIEYQWESTGAAAARVSGERRFELALIDVGLRNPEVALQALALSGRRLQHAVILFCDETTSVPANLVEPGTEVVALRQAPDAVLAALRGDRQYATRVLDGAQGRR